MYDSQKLGETFVYEIEFCYEISSKHKEWILDTFFHVSSCEWLC